MYDSIKPVRLQLSRKKGSRMESPNGLPVVKVCRPTKWGNPFTVADARRLNPTESDALLRRRVVRAYRAYLTPGMRNEARRELAGKNVGCWCRLADECHGDVLLRVANAPREFPAASAGKLHGVGGNPNRGEK